MRLHGQHVLPVEGRSLPAGDLVAGVTHDGKTQRGLARTVRSHQGMDLAPANFQAHALEDRLLADADVKIGDREESLIALPAAHAVQSWLREIPLRFLVYF